MPVIDRGLSCMFSITSTEEGQPWRMLISIPEGLPPIFSHAGNTTLHRCVPGMNVGAEQLG